MQRSGVGQTSQEAIATGLTLALRRVSEHFDAAEIEYIELTKYPSFVLARFRVYPYQIQRGAVLPSFDRAVAMSIIPQAKAVAVPGNGVAAMIQ